MNIGPFSAVAIGASVIYGAAVSIDVAFGQPEPRVLVLAQLRYDGQQDAWTQQVVSESGKNISAAWRVQITRNTDVSEQLCAGGGVGIYNGEVDVWPTRTWVGDDCPDLMPGDRAEVVWEYVNHYGITTSLGATYVIGSGQVLSD